MAKTLRKRGNVGTPKPNVPKKMLVLVGAYASETESDDMITGRRSEAHSFKNWLHLSGPKEVTIDLKEAKSRWEEGLETVRELIEVSAAKAVGGWELDEVSIGMTLTAKGKLAFIAEAGVEASIHFVFKQKP